MSDKAGILNEVQSIDDKIAELKAMKDGARDRAISEIKQLLEKFAILPHEVFEGISAKKSTRPPVLPKYRHRKTGATWSGRGKCPKGFETDNLGAFIEDVEVL